MVLRVRLLMFGGVTKVIMLNFCSEVEFLWAFINLLWYFFHCHSHLHTHTKMLQK